MDVLAAAFWAALAGLRTRQLASGDPLAFLLAAQAAMVAWCLLRRWRPATESSLRWRLMAWGSSLLPFAARGGGTVLAAPEICAALMAFGLLLAIWALWNLGPSFGVAPADRGLVARGPYRFLRHPVYAGEFINLAGFTLSHAQPWNAAVLLAVATALVARTVQEERVIAGYAVYAARVRWRLFPGVW